METCVKFSTEDWDSRSDMSRIHLSYLIQLLLPTRLVGWDSVKRLYDGAVAGMQMSMLDESDMFIVTGSTAEGLSVPMSVTRTNPPRIEKHADVDVLLLFDSLKISTVQPPESGVTECKAYFDSTGVHPGYTRIYIPSIKQTDETFVYCGERKGYFLSGTKLMEKIYSTNPTWRLAPSEMISLHGPALTFDDNTELTTNNFKTPNLGGSRDLVLALPCSPWPQQAAGWKDRAYRSSWLDKDLVDSVIADGCHVVAVPSKNSTEPDIEWRISFSASEGRLAREAITDSQRQCYIYLKILRYQALKNEPVLPSYVFKSVFLHCCEQLPVESWKSNPSACVLYMLDVVLECLEKRHVPTYFLPENNLIGHLNDEELSCAKDIVSRLREDPITPVLEFTDTRVLGLQNTLATFRELIQPLLEDMSRFKQHRDISRSLLEGILATANQVCLHLLYEKSSDQTIQLVKHREAVISFVDVYVNWLQPRALDASLLQVINVGGQAITDVNASLSYFKAVVSLSDEFPDFLSARGHLACLLHSAAYTHPEGSEERTEYIKQAGELFRKVYTESKSNSIDFVTYLVKQGNYEEAMNVINDILANKDTTTASVYAYDMKESNVLPDPLQQHVQSHGKIVGDPVAFAYFYKTKCLVNSGKDMTVIQKVLGEFEKYCQDKNDDNATILFSYAMQEGYSS